MESSLQTIEWLLPASVVCRVRSDSAELRERLKADFDAFPKAGTHSRTVIEVTAHRVDRIPFDRIPAVAAEGQSSRCLTYVGPDGRIFKDYHGEALVIFGTHQERFEIFAARLDRLHELTYLLLLSRAGKIADLRGWHKVHAVGVSYRGRFALCLLPSHGGKTTLLSELLSDPEIDMLSDDTPIVDARGCVHAFPLRVGFDQIPRAWTSHSSTIMTMDRKEHGPKKLLSTRHLRSNFPTTGLEGGLLLIGRRSRAPLPTLRRATFFETTRGLSEHLIVGLGLPMILEYFFESGVRDLGARFLILGRRLWAALSLMRRSRAYVFEMGLDPAANAALLTKTLKND